MNRFFIVSVLIILVFFVLIWIHGTSLSLAGIPKLINYQGMLTGSDGKTPVTDGPYNLTFKIYGSESGMDSLWRENHPTVQVTNGLFNVILGSVTSLNLAFDTDYWLGIRVGSDDELSPRIRLTSVGYAYRAQVADSAVVAVSAPTGGGWTDDGAVVRLTNNSDSVGIGKTNPSSKLDVNGKINTSDFYMIEGNQALSAPGDGNTFVGIYAGASSTGDKNTFLGESAGHSNPSGGGNTFLGAGAGFLNTIGGNNTSVGAEAGKSSTGSDNVFVGSCAGVLSTTGDFNTFLGSGAGYYNGNGFNNTFLGCNAGLNDTGSGNVFIGFRAGWNEKGFNKLYIANSSVDPPLIYGDFSTGRLGFGTTSPSGETKVHIRTTTDNFGVLVDADDTSGSEIGLHTATSKYASLVKNAYYNGDWQRFDTGSGAFLQQVSPNGDVLFRVTGTGANPISWTEDLAMRSNGNVGIGTTNPQEKLHVWWGTNVDAELGRGVTDPDITYLALRNANGTKCYIYPNAAGDGIVVSTTKP
jgi:hypothetical protein